MSERPACSASATCQKIHIGIFAGDPDTTEKHPHARSSVRLIRPKDHKLCDRRRGRKPVFPTLLTRLFKMGLSGRKIKQRIPQDPRNLSWADGSVDALSTPPTSIAQPSVHRCISFWFYISIQARLRPHRQKRHPGNLRSRSHPTSQGKLCSFSCE